MEQHGSSTSILLQVDATPRRNKKNTKRTSSRKEKTLIYQLFKKRLKKCDPFLVHTSGPAQNPITVGKCFEKGPLLTFTIRILSDCYSAWAGPKKYIFFCFCMYTCFSLSINTILCSTAWCCGRPLLRRHGRHLSITLATQFTTTAVRRAQFCWKGRKIWHLPGSPKIMAIQPTPPGSRTPPTIRPY